MKKKEPIETLREMAIMHDDLGKHLDEAMKRKQYVEASWLCYSIFEQRINRIIQKHISKCPKQKREKGNYHVGISTRIRCLKKLNKTQYGIYASFDKELLDEISEWCKKRNILMHDLVNLKHYKKYDKEFEALAKSGVPLVKRIYAEATKVRNWYREDNNKFPKFPEITCRCSYRCVSEEM